MIRELQLSVTPAQADAAGLREAAAIALGVDSARVLGVAPLRRAVDARHGKVTVKYTLLVAVDEPLPVRADSVAPQLPDLTAKPYEAVVVGAGPAGLFAAWGLALRGVRSIVIERGGTTRSRRPALARLNREGVLDLESNYCFGEGGAGTYSDGKLYTRAKKRGPIAEVLGLLVGCGAPERILYEARPHIGTNRLPGVVTALRERLEIAGVDVRFDTRVEGLLQHDGRVTGVALADGERIEARSVVLATGHSARDIYRLLHHAGVELEAKGFALGVRVEHPQALINSIQHGEWAGHENLGSAPYALKRTVQEIGTFSFCMCPGGFIVAAATEADGVVVNGMSPSARNSQYANSGVVVTVGPEDYAAFGAGPLAGIEFQAAVERAAFSAGGGRFKAPAQRLTDFISGRSSTTLPECSYRPGLEPARLADVLPKKVNEHLVDGLKYFGASRMRGYVTADAVVVGVESRSSAPVRVPRDKDSLQSVSHPGLYPCGEGAGYAGGIVSAALDGLRIARVIAPE